MFILVRRIKDSTEILTKSNSQTPKTFPDLQTAKKFAYKLNDNMETDKQWKVKSVMGKRNRLNRQA
ncbi:hypothetical protein ACFOGI_15235 [Virgibacillus xinjiangensis]|uniref:Uncharacterized protein n=1 Tax=Virgibacillus xinjiangensis TaxID=393090 RepID=A0ABV7CYL5_9BACI